MNLKPWHILSSDNEELRERALSEPLRARKSWRYRIVGDLFFTLGAEDIAAIFGVMAASSRHTFEIATESPHMMREWFKWIVEHDTSCDPWTNCHWFALMTDENDDGPVHRLSGDDAGSPRPWPLPNLRLTTHVTTQAEADARIPALLACPAASYALTMTPGEHIVVPIGMMERFSLVTVSGGTAPMDPRWVRLTRDQCAGTVPFKFEGWGRWLPIEQMTDEQYAAIDAHDALLVDHGRYPWGEVAPGVRVYPMKPGCSGRLLDGVTHDGEQP